MLSAQTQPPQEPIEVAATEGPIPVGQQAAHAPLKLHQSINPGSKIFLTIEGLSGTQISASGYAVYLQSPEDGAEKHRAGVVSTFGVVEVTRAGRGMATTLDATEAFAQLPPGTKNLRVLFEPIPDASGRTSPGDCSVKRIILYESIQSGELRQ